MPYEIITFVDKDGAESFANADKVIRLYINRANPQKVDYAIQIGDLFPIHLEKAEWDNVYKQLNHI